MPTQAKPRDDDMPDEIDFFKGTRGKIFTPAAALHLPVYLDAEVQAWLATRSMDPSAFKAIARPSKSDKH